MFSKKETTRSRGPNFTKEEQDIFVKVIETYIPIIECKKTDSIKLRDKHRAWAKITALFNAKTNHCYRTTENLISCYRNMKNRVKKQRSEAKMMLKDHDKKEALISAFEENGGGPPVSDDDDKIKKIIEPQIDVLYTINDGNSALMKRFQENISENVRIQPNGIDFIDKNGNPWETPSCSKTSIDRTDILKKKWDSALCVGKEKKNVNDGLVQLSEEITRLNQEVAAEELKEKKLSVELKELEIAHKKKLYDLEMENVIKDNIFKEEMRKKELLLMDLKIKKIEK